jgi:hypothetical protein
MRLYQVSAKCGHVGRNNFVIKNFAVKANDGKEAARLARNFPRVKHHQKDAILSVVEITPDEFECLTISNSLDPYFRCTNVQEQRMYEEVIYAEETEETPEPKSSLKNIYCGKQLIRNPRKYMRNFCYTERYAV